MLKHVHTNFSSSEAKTKKVFQGECSPQRGSDDHGKLTRSSQKLSHINDCNKNLPN